MKNQISGRKKIYLSVLGILILAVVGGLITWPKGPNLGKNEIKLHLGLDLAGGAHLVYQADTGQIPARDRESAVAGTRDVIERRVNIIGVSEPVVQTNKSGDNYRIIVELPGVADVNQAIRFIGETPILEFKEENVPAQEAKVDEKGQAKVEAPEVRWVNTPLSGKQLKHSRVEFDTQTGSPIVALEFNKDGADLFAEITGRNVNKRIAIFLDGGIISAPVVQQKIEGGNAVITGNFNLKEARDLVKRLNAGALPVPVKLISQQTVGPSLGKESLNKSFVAGIIGLIAVALFMILYYRVPGVVSVVALGIYTLILISLFKLIPVTLTLAGIAGFILSIGMAVDANVLIFERMKEERKLGKTMEAVIDDGFKRAWNSIRDSNVSSLITCLILYWFGTSLIRGFAITLALGILVSMFTAITITRILLKLVFSAKFAEKLYYVPASNNPKS